MISGSTDNVGAGYDNARRLVDFASKLSSNESDLARFTYGYDAIGNRTFERREHEPSTSNRKGEAYTYDAVYRLTKRQEGDLDAGGTLVGSTSVTQDYVLDGAGNWKTHKRNAVSYNQTINTLNQYTVFNGPDGQRSLFYDFQGNLTNESVPAQGYQQYSYDFLNRLAMYLDVASNMTTYRYDALGRRISKNFNGLQTHYVYDGAGLIEERDGDNGVKASYLLGRGPDEVLSRRAWSGGSSTDIYYHTNALGSVAAVSDSGGAVVERYKYDAYGQVTVLSPTFTPLTSSALANNVLFTGRYFDVETRLHYFRARTYHPYLGRFLQRDPLGEAASLNLYNYVFNNPVNRVDPTGMWSPPAGAGGGSTAPIGMASERAWQERQAKDAVSMQQAEEAMQQLDGYTAMEDAHAAGIAAQKLSNWADYYADRQGHRNQELANQIKASLTDPQNMTNMEKPKGVGVFIYGIWQNPLREAGPGGCAPKDKSEMDNRAQDMKDDGWVVIQVASDALAQVGQPNEPSHSGINILANAIDSITSKGTGSMKIEINAFSRGGGGAVALINELTDNRGYTGRNITARFYDPKFGPSSSVINNKDVNVNLNRSSQFGFVDVATWFAHMGSDLYQTQSARVPAQFYNLPHTHMDSMWPFGSVPTYVPGN